MAICGTVGASTFELITVGKDANQKGKYQRRIKILGNLLVGPGPGPQGQA